MRDDSEVGELTEVLVSYPNGSRQKEGRSKLRHYKELQWQ
jgi:hypothetical protein